MLAVLLCALVVALTAWTAIRGSAKGEKPLIIAGFAAHIAGIGAFVLYHEHTAGGDMTLYRTIGVEFAKLMERDSRYVMDVVKLALHMENDLGLDMFQGSSSGTMSALMAGLIFLFGNNLYAICLPVSMFAFVGQLLMYRAVATRVSQVERRPLLGAFMLIPSVVFWSSGFVKEAIVIGFLGLTCRGLTALVDRRAPILSILLVGVGLLGIALLKPYTLLPLVLGAGGWVYASRHRRRLGFGYKVLGLAVGLVGLFLISRLFPEFSADNLATNVAKHQQSYSLIAEGGSNVDMGDAEYDDPTLSRQVKYLPLALINALLRPFIFEARSASTLMAGLEMTVLLWLMISLLRKAGFAAIVREVTRRPPLMFAALFVLSFGVAVGLTTRNLGTMSRYRVPALPMYVGLLVALRAHFGAVTAKSRTKARPRTALPRRAPNPAIPTRITTK